MVEVTPFCAEVNKAIPGTDACTFFILTGKVVSSRTWKGRKLVADKLWWTRNVYTSPDVDVGSNMRRYCSGNFFFKFPGDSQSFGRNLGLTPNQSMLVLYPFQPHNITHVSTWWHRHSMTGAITLIFSQQHISGRRCAKNPRLVKGLKFVSISSSVDMDRYRIFPRVLEHHGP